MALELKQQLKLTQQLIMTPQLQMAIKLLQLSRLELMDAIQQELEENPALDEVQEHMTQEEQRENAEEASEPEKEVTIEEKLNDEIDWSNYIDEYNTPGNVHFETEEKDAVKFESFVAKKESLSDHLLWQLLMTSPTSQEKEIGSLIIGNINRNGYMDTSLENLIEESGFSSEVVEKVLSVIQSFDPVGVCARDLKECLLIQAKHFGFDNRIVTQIINNHMNHLENKNYNAIIKKLKVNKEEVISAIDFIKGLEPMPGRQFSDENPHYIEPDIYVHKTEDGFAIVLNDDGMPRLQLNAIIRNAIRKDGELTANAKDYMNEKIRSASWLIKSIHQRQKTIYKVMESILKFQRDFFDKGINYLKPMVLKDVANDIEMHESTISRVTTNKYAYTPQGIFELKYFFNSSINRIKGDAIASASVQQKIKQIIESEDPRKPYSDDKISEILKKSNINIARRTVAKYREMMRILSSNKRRQY